eukprot:CAMPEP_0198110190 /NCGR_PEP_ID=MMETSP1442-20131203/2204_1 /TAXON_ID= /ORGANISM="Craspedostauros australis, Strain CCMP3328" /LENGTH=213 /DNA_ID=CAMNT_0043766141 /DNA_START=519 /DNA_END=1160 /DNA_ORIENTATION=+
MTVEAFQPNPTSVPASTSGASRPDTQTSTTSTSSQLDYATVPASLEVRPKHAKTVRKKPSITSLHSLDELKYFLEDDDRLTVVKFYAPWCKSCKKLDIHFNNLASKIGDGVVARQMVKGDVRFAQIAFGDATRELMENLKIAGLPTMQLYHRDHKLWNVAGHTNTKSLQSELGRLEALSQNDLEEYGEEIDDGVLNEAVEDSMYDYSFLNEEW